MAAPSGSTLRVLGLREMLIACDNAGKETKKYVRETLRESGDAVKRDAGRKFERYDSKTAAGYRTRVRRTGVAVEQSLRKSAVESRRRPKFGALQMQRALVPALDENEAATERAMEHAMDLVCDHFESMPV
jgi:hypothetical protein